MVSCGLFSISLRRARIRSAVVSRGDICNPRTPFTLVSSTKSLVHRLSAPTDTGPGLSHKEEASRWEDADTSISPLTRTRCVGAANCTNCSGNRKGPEPRLGPRPSIDRVAVCALGLTLGGPLCFPGTSLSRLHTSLPERECRVQEVHVGFHRLPGEGLRSLRLALLLVGQLLSGLPVLLGLRAEILHHPVEEGLGELRVLLLGCCASLSDHLIGLNEGARELLGGLIYPLLTLLVGHRASYSLLPIAAYNRLLYLPRYEQP